MPNKKATFVPIKIGLLVISSLLISSFPFLPLTTTNIADLGTFFGRFHPLILHFPIVLILLIIGLEFWRKYQKNNYLDLLELLLISAALTCFITVVMGFLLYRSGEYQGALVQQHLWGGVVLSLSVNTALFFYWKWQKSDNKLPNLLYQLSLLVAGIATIYTSHLGGSITHGTNFLTEHLPSFGNTPSDLENKKPEDLLVYEDLIKPTLENRCFSCHNNHKTKGGLLMTTLIDLQKGGKSGKSMLVANRPSESELFHRITLPLDHEERMPPKEKTPLTANEISLIHWWIREGASSDTKVGLTPPDSIALLLQKHLPDLYKSQRLKKRQQAEHEALSKELAEFGKKLGLEIEPDRDTEGQYFAVSMKMPPSIVDNETISKLMVYKDLFSKISLVGADITDEALYDLGRMRNLNALFLANTKISGAGLVYLKTLPKLELLNLSHSFLNNSGILHLNQLANLKTCYLYDTKVDPIILEALQKHQPKVQWLEEEGLFY